MPAPLSSGIRRALLNSRPVEDGYTPPLDELSDLSTLFGANSVYRRLISSYVGALIRVRRDSDNAELDIGQTSSGFLDTAALIAFGSGTTVDMKLCYDQSGNNRSIGHSGGIQQPTIFSGGALRMTSLGWPAPYCNFSGATEYLYYTTPPGTLFSPVTYHYVFEPATRPVGGGFLLDGGGPGTFLELSMTTQASPSLKYNYFLNATGPTQHNTDMPDNASHVMTGSFSDAIHSGVGRIKHDHDAAYSVLALSTPTTIAQIDGYTFYSSGNGTFGENGYWQEFIAFSSALSDDDKDILHSNSLDFYGI